MANEQACPAPCEEVFDVENKWPYLPITPTYDQYVQRWVVMPEREGFHLKTRSAMKQLLEDAKWMIRQKEEACVLQDSSGSRLTIKLDRLIVLSKSSLLGWFLHVSLIVIIKGRSPMEVSLIVIINQV